MRISDWSSDECSSDLEAPIVPVLRAGDDDDGALRVVSVAPPFRTGAEEIKRRNLAGGCDMGRARTLGGRPWATGIGAIHCRRIVAHGFHGGALAGVFLVLVLVEFIQRGMEIGRAHV